MRKFGLIGYPLTHSFSKKYFEEKFKREKIPDCTYDLFPLTSVQEFSSLIQSNPYLAGLNVTIPYKESVIEFLDELDSVAKEIGAVNCIANKNGKLKGYNTDAFGFEISLKRFLTEKPEQAFVLGTGGSSRAVCYVLKKMNIPFIKVSREPKKDCIVYDKVKDLIKTSNLFINSTPVGMYPETNFSPEIPYDKLTGKDFLFDLVYNPEETLFLKYGKAKGAKTKNGLEMLELQAEESWRIWNS